MKHLLAEQFTPTDVGTSVEEVRNEKPRRLRKGRRERVFLHHLDHPQGLTSVRQEKCSYEDFPFLNIFQQHLEVGDS